VKLKDVLSSITGAFISAKSSMDRMSMEHSKQYQKEDLLSAANLPFFSISDVRLELRFAVGEIGRDNEVFVSVNTPSLEKLPPHVISTVEIKLTPQPLKLYKMEDGKTFNVS